MIISTETEALRKLVGDRKTIEILAKAGFDAIDYTFTPGLENGTSKWLNDNYKEYAKELNMIADDNGVYFNQAHGPFIFNMEYLPDWDREILPLLIRCFECCALLGIQMVVVHPIHHLPYRFNKKTIWDLNFEFYNLLRPYAKEFGVKVALENMFSMDDRRKCAVPDMFSNPHEFSQFYDELGDEENFVCLVDTGHCGLVGEDVGDTIRVLGKRVKGLHANDNMFQADDHLIPFQGTIDWHDTMKALAEVDYQGDLSMEALWLWRGVGEDFYSTQASYLHDVASYLVKIFNDYKMEISR